MFFIGLTLSLILLLSGVFLLIKASYLIGSILLGSGILLSILLIIFYRNRKRKKEKDGFDCLDCNPGAADCMNIPSFKKMDCDCDGDKGFDCDCAPDCTP